MNSLLGWMRLLLFLVVCPSCDSLMQRSGGDGGVIRPPGEGRDLALEFGDAVLMIESVEIAPDIRDNYVAQAAARDSTITEARVAQVLEQLKDEARSQITLLAARDGLRVYTRGQGAQAQDGREQVRVSFVIDSLDVVPTNTGNGSGAQGVVEETLLLISSNVIKTSAEFRCKGTLSALAADGAVLSMARALGKDNYLITSRSTTTASYGEESQGQREVDDSQAFTLNGPTKEAVRKAVNFAWDETWALYSARVASARGAARAVRHLPAR